MAGQGTKILATDYNTIQSTISQVLGTGSGDYGYGQTVLSSQVSVNAKISVTQWSNLRTDILRARQHQTGTDLTSVLTTPTVSVKLTEADRAAYKLMADDASTNRLGTPPAGQATLENLVDTQVRTTAWQSTSQTITVNFGSADDARYYFNTGGQIQFSASRSGGSGGLKNDTWTTMLSQMGTIAFKYNTTTCSGSGTPYPSVGYTTLTTSNQTIFEKTLAPSASYYPNKYYILARQPSSTQLVFTVYWADDSGQPNPPWGTDENVDGTLTSTVQVYRASGSNVTIAKPSASTSGI